MPTRGTKTYPFSRHRTIGTNDTARAAPGVHVGQPAPKGRPQSKKASRKVRSNHERCDVRSAGVADWITARGGNTERTLTATAPPPPRDPYRHALTMRPPQKVRPFSFLNYQAPRGVPRVDERSTWGTAQSLAFVANRRGWKVRLSFVSSSSRLKANWPADSEPGRTSGGRGMFQLWSSI